MEVLIAPLAPPRALRPSSKLVGVQPTNVAGDEDEDKGLYAPTESSSLFWEWPERFDSSETVVPIHA